MTRPLKDKKILVADDEPLIRDLLEDILAPAGALVRLASSGHEALHIIDTHPLDLAILDVHMPGVDGLTIVEQLREQGNHLPIIIITGHVFPQPMQHHIQNHTSGLVAKPFDPTRILHTVQQTLCSSA